MGEAELSLTYCVLIHGRLSPDDASLFNPLRAEVGSLSGPIHI